MSFQELRKRKCVSDDSQVCTEQYCTSMFNLDQHFLLIILVKLNW